MKQIKFSHQYQKMPLNIDAETVIDTAFLLAVFNTSLEELDKGFLQYDTMFINDKDEPEFYELPKGKLLVLLLQGTDAMGSIELWTTIRRWTPEKERYYRSNLGEQFEIVIDKTNNKTI